MPDAPAWFLLVMFICPMGEAREAFCGPSSGQYGPFSEAVCHARGREYQAQVKDVPVLREQRYSCFRVGMGK